jgi:hypothetical protein
MLPTLPVPPHQQHEQQQGSKMQPFFDDY